MAADTPSGLNKYPRIRLHVECAYETEPKPTADIYSLKNSLTGMIRSCRILDNGFSAKKFES